MANYHNRYLIGLCLPLTLLCGILTICVIVTGVLGIVEGINGDPTDPWYLLGAAAVAALLLPLVATPLTWAAVEVLLNQADKTTPEFSLPKEDPTTDEQIVRKYSDVLSVSEDDKHPGTAVAMEVLLNQDDKTSLEFSLPTEQPMPGGQVVSEHSSVVPVSEDDKSPGTLESVQKTVKVGISTNRRPTAELKARNIEFLDAEVYKIYPRIDRRKFQRLNKAACAMVYIALMCFSLSIVCLLWSFSITVHVASQASGVFGLVIVSHVLASFMCPTFAMVGLFLLSTVGNYVSAGMIDFRRFYCSILPSVKMVMGEMVHQPKFTFKFWVIADLLYIRLRSPRGSPKNLCYYIDRTPATYILAAIVWLAVSFAVWFFIESIQVETMTITTPVTEDVCNVYTCLRIWKELDCSKGANISEGITMTCFYFRLDRDAINILTLLVLAFAIYLSGVQIFKFTIAAISILLMVRQTKLWGLLLLLGHALLLIAMVIWVSLDESVTPYIKSKLVVIPIFLILVDFLLLTGGVNEVIKKPRKARCIIVKPESYLKGLRHMNTLTEVEVQLA